MCWIQNSVNDFVVICIWKLNPYAAGCQFYNTKWCKKSEKWLKLSLMVQKSTTMRQLVIGKPYQIFTKKSLAQLIGIAAWWIPEMKCFSSSKSNTNNLHIFHLKCIYDKTLCCNGQLMICWKLSFIIPRRNLKPERSKYQSLPLTEKKGRVITYIHTCQATPFL